MRLPKTSLGEIGLGTGPVLLVICLATAVGVMVGGGVAGAFNTAPLRLTWRTPPRARSCVSPAVTYSVDVAIEHGRSDPEQIGDTQLRALERYRNVATQAAAAWAPALPIAVREATADAPDIELQFVPSGDSNFKGREVGKTICQFDAATHTLVHASCWIDEDLRGAALQHAVDHELGHALGMIHSSCRDDVMYPDGSNGGITERDLAAMRSVYAQ